MTLKCKHGTVLNEASCLTCEREVQLILKDLDTFFKAISIDWGVPVDVLRGSKCTKENTKEFLKVLNKGRNEDANISKSKT